MPCYHPLTAWRTESDTIVLTKEAPRAYKQHLQLPCGKCMGCNTAHAKAWALRCRLELQQHARAVFTTLTYSDENLPATLSRRHLQLYLKRLRASTDNAIRFFATGEYGTKTQRPHYHAILYGLAVQDHQTIEDQWGLGQCRTRPANVANICYTAGYCDKKKDWKQHSHERVNPETGELYQWQAPFIQMSRRPGIGGHARKHTDSWRAYAITDGHKMPVPRFLHEAWKKQATENDLQQLAEEKDQYIQKHKETNLEQAEKIAVAQHTLTAERRNY